MEIDLSRVLAYSKDCLQSRAQMRAIMMDLYPEKTRDMNILLAVYESGVPKEIKNSGTVNDSQYASYIDRIKKDYGLQEKYVVEGLNAWIDVCIAPGASKSLNYDFSQKDDDGEYEKGTEKKEFEFPQITGTKQTSSDYEYVDTDNGIEIVKYIGFDRKIIDIPSVIDGKRVEGIGESAFAKIPKVEKIVVPEGVRYIKEDAFYYCKSLREVNLPDSLEIMGVLEPDYYVEVGIFSLTPLKEIHIPRNVRFIPAACFAECDELEKVYLPEGIAEIGYSAFSECKELKTINFPASLRKIGENAFWSCDSLKQVILKEGLKEIGECAFDAEIETIVLPRSVTIFGEDILGRYGFDGTVYCYQGSEAAKYARGEGYNIEDASSLG